MNKFHGKCACLYTHTKIYLDQYAKNSTEKQGRHFGAVQQSVRVDEQRVGEAASGKFKRSSLFRSKQLPMAAFNPNNYVATLAQALLRFRNNLRLNTILQSVRHTQRATRSRKLYF